MQRDFDLIRKILLAAESQPAGSGDFYITFPNEYPNIVVFEHTELLIEAGSLEGEVSRSLDLGLRNVSIRRLTWAGHDFIEAIQSDSNWSKIKSFLLEAGKVLSIETIKFAARHLFGASSS